VPEPEGHAALEVRLRPAALRVAAVQGVVDGCELDERARPPTEQPRPSPADDGDAPVLRGHRRGERFEPWDSVDHRQRLDVPGQRDGFEHAGVGRGEDRKPARASNKLRSCPKQFAHTFGVGAVRCGM